MLTDLSTAKVGKNVKVYPLAKIIHRGSNLIIDDYAQIDDFVFINAGAHTKIGRFAHIASFVSVVGGGEWYLDDFAVLAAGCRMITGSDDFGGSYLVSSAVPEKYKNVKLGKVIVGKYAMLATNVIVMPNVCIGEGASVGAGSIVTRDLEPWGIYAGFTAKKVGERDRKGVIEREAQLLKEVYGEQYREKRR